MLKSNQLEYQCPLCHSMLKSRPGSALNACDGVTLFCSNEACPAQEVVGHGSNEKEAFEVINHKYRPIRD